MKKITYTEKLHVHRLKLMLRRNKPCNLCPAKPKFDAGCIGIARLLTGVVWRKDKYKNDPCEVCRGFISNGDLERRHMLRGCPCTVLGKDKALLRTVSKLSISDSKLV